MRRVESVKTHCRVFFFRSSVFWGHFNSLLESSLSYIALLNIASRISLPIQLNSTMELSFDRALGARYTIIIKAIISISILQFHHSCHAQQSYLNNNQLKCEQNFTNTNGFLCNGVNTTCNTYLTFRAIQPYDSVPTIAYFLNSSPSSIAQLNNVNDIHTFSTGDLVLAPIDCSCTSDRKYYQHNSSYTLKFHTETYFTIANDTYEGLTTCQALMEQNPYEYRNLSIGLKLIIPIMCACPTVNQTKVGVKALVNYLVTWNDDISSIADMFGVDQQSVLDANELKSDSVIYPFTPILVPIKTIPPQTRLLSPPPESPPTNGTGDTGSGGGGGGSSKTWIYAVVGVVSGLLLILLVLFIICFYRRRGFPPLISKNPSAQSPVGKGDKLRDPESSDYAALDTSTTSNGDNNTTNSWSISSDGVKYAIGSLSSYRYDEVKRATKSFSSSNRIKGSVYRGSFKGDAAAIKILKGDVTREINILKQINHLNIIRLSGYCVHDGSTCLVYEFAEKGCLRDWLEKSKEKEKYTSSVFSWKIRIQIAYGVADALNYLHNYTSPPYIHKNLTSSNVLLDSDFRAKITNFGLARSVENEDEGGLHLTNYVVGTQGYLAPEYIENGVVTPKLDVFAFGMVLLELLSGKVATAGGGNGGGKSNSNGVGEDEEELLTAVSVKRVIEGGNVREKLERFMDSGLQNEYPLEMAYSMVQLANSCVAQDMNSRPPISEILMVIAKIHSSSLDWDPLDELDRTSSISNGR